MIRRAEALRSIRSTLSRSPVCVLLGPRQCGKTTLAREVAAKRRAEFIDLETSTGRARLADPDAALARLSGLVVIDEAQRDPRVFAALRPLVDRPGNPARFLLLGSASPDVVRGVSESLAGRAGFVDLGGFDLGEVGGGHQQRLWMRGGFPRSFLARSEAASFQWRQDFIRTFLERDIPQLGIRIAPEALRRCWMMIAHSHAQLWSGAELARSLGVSEHTVRGYLDVLTGAFVIRQLQPWFENVGKRQYKSPKVYIRDSGVLHALLSIERLGDLEAHPKFGASWEGFALEQVLSLFGSRDAYFWGTHGGAELDLLLFRHGRRFGVEFKAAGAPQMTKSLHIALADLGLERAWIVYPGEDAYAVHPKVDALPLGLAAAHLRRHLD